LLRLVFTQGLHHPSTSEGSWKFQPSLRRHGMTSVGSTWTIKSAQTSSRRHGKLISYDLFQAWEGYVLLRWNARLLVVFLGSDLDGIFLVLYADAADRLQTAAIASADAAAEVCRWRDYQRRIRRTARQTRQGCQDLS